MPATGGNLWRMGNRQNLGGLTERLETLAHGVSGRTSDASVNLVKNECHVTGAGAQTDFQCK